MPSSSRSRPSVAVIALSALAAVAIALAVVVVGSPAASVNMGRTVTASRGVIQSTVSGSGTLAPVKQLELNFGTSGEITRIYVKEGEHVSAGQMLARIDDSSTRVAVAKAEADLASAQEQLATATASTATAAGSASTAPSTGAGAGGAGVSAGSAAAEVASANLALEGAQKELTDTVLRAPVQGTVASIAASAGEMADSSSSTSSSSAPAAQSSSGTGGDTAAQASSGSGFITLAQLQRFKMEVSLSESDIGKVKVGQAATVTVNAVSGLKLSGHVSKIGLLASSSSSSSAVSYPVTILMEQGAKAARAGMSASADIVVSQASGVTVPTQAVSGSTVKLVKDGERITTQVQTGVVGDTTTQIVSGLRAGDQVYVESASAAAGAAATGSASQQGQNRRPGLGGGLGGGFLGGGPPGGRRAGGGG